MGLYNPVSKGSEPSDSAAAVTNSLSTTESTLCPANENRKGLSFYNSTSSTMLVSKVTPVTATAFQFKMTPGQFFIHPMKDDPYTGPWYAVLDDGTGSAQVVESD